MIGHQRPGEPASWAPHVRVAVDLVRALAEAGEFERVSAYLNDPENALWRAARGPLYETQRKKCAWCERPITGGSDPEHYAPKGRVTWLRTHGTESPSMGSFPGRGHPRRHPLGYWWLAYAWTNLTLACRMCNLAKSSDFPVAEDPHPFPEPGRPYTPLLLDPFASGHDDQPERHLACNAIGELIPISASPRAQPTIDTCALNRPSLVDDRIARVQEIDRLFKNILDLDAGPASARSDIRQIVTYTQGEETFAAVARSRIPARLDMDWRELAVTEQVITDDEELLRYVRAVRRPG